MSADSLYALLERITNLVRNEERSAGLEHGLQPVHDGRAVRTGQRVAGLNGDRGESTRTQLRGGSRPAAFDAWSRSCHSPYERPGRRVQRRIRMLSDHAVRCDFMQRHEASRGVT